MPLVGCVVVLLTLRTILLALAPNLEVCAFRPWVLARQGGHVRAIGRGEIGVREAFSEAIMVRPRVMFGPRRCIPDDPC